MTISRTGIFAAIPPIVGTIGSVVGGFSTDWLSRWGFSPLTCRKIPLVSGLIGILRPGRHHHCHRLCQ